MTAAKDGSTVPASTCKESNWKARFSRSNGKDLVVQIERYKLWAECWNDLQEQKQKTHRKASSWKDSSTLEASMKHNAFSKLLYRFKTVDIYLEIVVCQRFHR